MKKAIVSIEGGVADIESNEHELKIEIIDFDNNEQAEDFGSELVNELTEEEMKQFDAVVYVTSGVAEVVYEADGIDVEIVDYD